MGTPHLGIRLRYCGFHAYCCHRFLRDFQLMLSPPTLLPPSLPPPPPPPAPPPSNPARLLPLVIAEISHRSFFPQRKPLLDFEVAGDLELFVPTDAVESSQSTTIMSFAYFFLHLVLLTFGMAALSAIVFVLTSWLCGNGLKSFPAMLIRMQQHLVTLFSTAQLNRHWLNESFTSVSSLRHYSMHLS